jgi:ABC-type Co2+ transport system permease subunit
MKMDLFNFAKGYKSVIGCIAAVATFVTVVCTALADGFQLGDAAVIMGGFSALMLAIGWTSKLAGIEEASKK